MEETVKIADKKKNTINAINAFSLIRSFFNNFSLKINRALEASAGPMNPISIDPLKLQSRNRSIPIKSFLVSSLFFSFSPVLSAPPDTAFGNTRTRSRYRGRVIQYEHREYNNNRHPTHRVFFL